MDRPKVYVAGPFFNPEQIAIVDSITRLLRIQEIRYYSPKDDLLYEPGKTDPSYVFDQNCIQIETCNFVIAITNGKDVGTMFECGYAYAKHIPIIYVWLDPPKEQKFNLMLAESAASICHSILDLQRVIYTYKTQCFIEPLNMPQLEEIE